MLLSNSPTALANRDRKGADLRRARSPKMKLSGMLPLVALTLFAQDATFKVESKLVVVNVSVKDKSGNAITDLKKEDFEVLEDGKIQSLGVFELQKLASDVLPQVDTTQIE